MVRSQGEGRTDRGPSSVPPDKLHTGLLKIEFRVQLGQSGRNGIWYVVYIVYLILYQVDEVNPSKSISRRDPRSEHQCRKLTCTFYTCYSSGRNDPWNLQQTNLTVVGLFHSDITIEDTMFTILTRNFSTLNLSQVDSKD